MARHYSKRAGRKVGRVMREMKSGTLRSGRSGRKVTSRRQAIAIGLAEARREGARVPRKSSRAAKKSSRVTGKSPRAARKFARRPRPRRTSRG